MTYVEKIKSSSKKQEYKNYIEAAKKEIIDKIKEEEPNEEEIIRTSETLGDIENGNFDEKTVSLLAAGIGMETGGYPEGFMCQLITGAVMINNLYTDISRPNGKIKSSSKEITYNDIKNLFSYCPVYCNSGGSKYSYIGSDADLYLKSTGADDKMINQLKVVAKLLISKEFTIPQHVFGQGAPADWVGTDHEIWGKAYTGLPSYPYVYFAYLNNTGLDEKKDIYGNTVSNNFSDYQAIANMLYSKYIGD